MTAPLRKHSRQESRPRVGLALSGGAARGMAHVGVLRALEEHAIPIDVIAGTSAGALVGGVYAAGLSIDEIEELGRSLHWRDVGRTTISRLGIQSNARMEKLLRARLPVTRFEELRFPFVAVATDLNSGEPVVLSEGDLAFAIRASCCVPGWYIPVTDAQGRQLVDGGLVANIPVTYARDLGADLVIAVDVNAEGAKFLGPPHSIIGILLQTTMVVQRTAAIYQLKAADVVIRPLVGHIRWDEMARANELMTAGYDATLKTINEIRALLEEQMKPASRWYQLRRYRKRVDPPKSGRERPSR
ncbi:MAG: patatin-like phospholipase family protein [Pyrinomonadaceae bacterium]